MDYKRCPVCRKEKPIIEFHSRKLSKDGHDSICKICTYERVLKWQRNNKDRAKQWVKNYYKKYPWIEVLRRINTRCNYKEHPYYKKGIQNFLNSSDIKYLWYRDSADLMERPSIHRIDGHKHYTINNCMFLEYKEHLKMPRERQKV